ncbi:MAG TPA: gliding motility lipoprotein GldD [Bacteroidales bacterium]|nr:gliding motility lipoprotein GldD [Bacteroidales bacterium]HSA42119.1 gliding motility lipoprotein GldD [Bacteroidales bacterium]
MPAKNKHRLFWAYCCISAVFFAAGCTSADMPKPWGYFRIDLPDKQYTGFDTTYPYCFRYPAYARIMPKTDSLAEPYWINIQFPSFKGTIHLSYKPVRGNLPEYLEDARAMVMKHIPKADAIGETLINRPEDKVYGMVYDIRGSDAASPIQFFLTDSLRHFIRGALYFYVKPNNDSLSPVIAFLKQDIDTLVGSFHWEKEPDNRRHK